MLDLIILAILLIGFLIGVKRGFILQIVHLTGFILSFIVAYLYYDDLAPKVKFWIPYPTLDGISFLPFISEQFNLEETYYRAISFALIFFGTKILLHILGTMLDFLSKLPLLKQINGVAGGVIGLLESYFLIFVALYVAAFVPMAVLQEMMLESFLTQIIVEHTPIFSSILRELWLEYVAN